jgi:hypothetical protein
MYVSSIVGIQSFARRLERNSHLLSNKLLGKVTQKPPMLPHETLLRPVHPFLGKSPVTLTAGNRAWNKLGLESSSPLVSLRGSSTVKEVVTDLSDCLRLCHRKNVEWFEPTPSQRTESVLIGLIVHYTAKCVTPSSHVF